MVIPKSPTTALPPSSLTTRLTMTRPTGWSSLVIEQVTVGSPAARVTLPASKAPPSPLVQVQAVGRVAGQRELGQGVRAGRDQERRGGVGEGVGGASTAVPNTSAPALVVIPKSPTTALPPSSLTTTFSMTRPTGWSSLVIEQVTVGSPAARVTLPASKAPPSPLVQVQAVGRVAGQRELGQGVRAGRDRERRGGVGEGVGRGLDGGRRRRARPALVVIPKSPTTALPPSSLTTTFSMTRLTGWSSLVIEQVTVGSPAARVTLPASKAPPSPLVQVQAVGHVAGQRELGQGVRAGRDQERRGGVGEGVGRGLDGGRRRRARRRWW